MELVYIGDEYPKVAPAFIKPFQQKETEKQYDWEQVRKLMCTEPVSIRPATPEEMAAVSQHAALIQVSAAYLVQFLETSAEVAP